PWRGPQPGASVATANPGGAAAPAHFGLRILCRSNCAAVAGSPSKPTNFLARAGPPLLLKSQSRSSSPSRSADVTCGSSAAWVARRARPKPPVSRTPEPMVALLNPAGELDRTPALCCRHPRGCAPIGIEPSVDIVLTGFAARVHCCALRRMTPPEADP